MKRASWRGKPQTQLVAGLVAGDSIEVLIYGKWFPATACATPQGNLNCGNFYAKTTDGKRLLRWACKPNWRRA